MFYPYGTSDAGKKNQFVCLFLFLHSLLVIISELKSQICSNSQGISIQLENFNDIFMKYWSLGEKQISTFPFLFGIFGTHWKFHFALIFKSDVSKNA